MSASITSKANPRFKSLREQISAGGASRTHTLLLGGKLIEAWHGARRSPAGQRLRPSLGLVLEGAGDHPVMGTLGVPILTLGESLMRELADAGSPPGHALLMELGQEPAGAFPDRVIVPWGIQDPGNLGAILRSAAAFGFQEALLGPGCADPFSPKALRGSMGAAFLVPVRRCSVLPLDQGRWYALDGSPGAESLADADLSAPLRLLVGNEGHGWQDVQLPCVVKRLAIPMRGVESLNAAVAAGIACYEAARRDR